LSCDLNNKLNYKLNELKSLFGTTSIFVRLTEKHLKKHIAKCKKCGDKK